jgi:hypothetical protein
MLTKRPLTIEILLPSLFKTKMYFLQLERTVKTTKKTFSTATTTDRACHFNHGASTRSNEDGPRSMDKGGKPQEILYFIIYGITRSNNLKKNMTRISTLRANALRLEVKVCLLQTSCYIF